MHVLYSLLGVAHGGAKQVAVLVQDRRDGDGEHRLELRDPGGDPSGVDELPASPYLIVSECMHVAA